MYRETPKRDLIEAKAEKPAKLGGFKCFFGYHDPDIREILHVERANGKILRVFDPDRVFCKRCGAKYLKSKLTYNKLWKLCRQYDNVVGELPQGKEFRLLSHHASFNCFNGEGPFFGYGNTAYSEHFDDELFLDEFLDGLSEECKQYPLFAKYLLLADAAVGPESEF